MELFKQKQILKQRNPEEEKQEKKDEKPSDSKCDSASVKKVQNNYNT